MEKEDFGPDYLSLQEIPEISEVLGDESIFFAA